MSWNMKNGEIIGGCLLLAGFTIFGGGWEQLQGLQTAHNQAKALRQSEEIISLAADIANQRYESGCVLIVSVEDDEPTTVADGRPVVDRKYK